MTRQSASQPVFPGDFCDPRKKTLAGWFSRLEGRRREIAMSRKTLGIIVAVVGVALLVISALADVIGIGGGGFGFRQIAGVVVGALGAVLGGFAAFRDRAS